jgi:PTH1 family peptidyl-tRNA hydrolase
VKLVVGLGNPGRKYAHTRHNIGFWVLDLLARDLRLDFARRRGLCAVAEGQIGEDRLVLLKPLAYMNKSGEALRDWAAGAGVTLAATGTGGVVPMVVCDDLALPLGSLRIRARGSAGGQQGLASIIANLGSEDFPRVRLGIASAGGVIPPAEWADYVLSSFTAQERSVAVGLAAYAAEAVICLIQEGPAAAAGRFNRRCEARDPIPPEDTEQPQEPEA